MSALEIISDLNIFVNTLYGIKLVKNKRCFINNCRLSSRLIWDVGNLYIV